MNLKQQAVTTLKAIDYVTRDLRISAAVPRGGIVRGARFLSIGVRLANPNHVHKAMSATTALEAATGSQQVISLLDRGIVWYQFVLPTSHWETYYRSQLPTTKPVVGLAQARRLVEWNYLQHDYTHTLAVGKTGSGKTEMIKSGLLAITGQMTPQEVGFLIADVKRDKFKEFDQSAYLVGKIATEPEQVSSMIRWAFDETVKRKETSAYINKGGRRIFLVLDEAHDNSILGDEKNQRFEHIAQVQEILRIGREYGVHVVIGVQNANRSNLPGLMENLGNRFVGQVVDASASYTVTGRKEAAAHKLLGSGDFMHVSNELTRFQVALTRPSDYASLPRVELVRELRPIEREINYDALEREYQEKSAGGRPRNELLPAVAAHYLHNMQCNDGELTFSIADASRLFDLSRGHHGMHKHFVSKMWPVFKKLMETKANEQ